MKTILYPTDYSKNAWNAMKYSASLLKNEPCKLILLNVVYITPSSPEVIDMTFPESYINASKEQMAALLEQFKQLGHHPDSTFETECTYGYLTDTVEQESNDKQVDLIVMGTKGSTGLAEVLMGSNAASIIKNIKKPILSVPEAGTFNKLDKIIFAADCDPIENQKKLSLLRELAIQHNSLISILNIQEFGSDMMTAHENKELASLQDYFKGIQNKFHMLSGTSEENGIQGFAESTEADLVVTLKRDKSFLENLFNKSVTKKVAFHTEIPLLSLPE